MISIVRKLAAIALIMLLGLMNAWATTSVKDIKVTNALNQASVAITFTGDKPAYAFFSLHKPERVVVDVNQSEKIAGLPLNFNQQDLVKNIRSSKPKDEQSVRLVFDLRQRAKTRVVTQHNGNNYTVVFTITPENSPRANTAPKAPASAVNEAGRKPSNGTKLTKPASNSHVGMQPAANIVVAIDAGHGGQDPGAVGPKGLQEKNVTLAISEWLRVLLDADPMFKPVMTRSGDYFVSVMGRSDVARKHGANVLVSIHADAAPIGSANGASVWVLSNRRANSEMGTWLEKHEKQSELLGGAGDVLANSKVDPYLSQAVLDLQFGHSQRVGYDVAEKVLQQLQKVGALHKNRPEHASLGVLRSPDIPSLLIETGFISNSSEERQLRSSAYQNKIAQAIYHGLRNYFLAHPLQMAPKVDSRPLQLTDKANASAMATKPQQHKVVSGDTLSSIARRYGVSIIDLQRVNKLKSDVAPLGRVLKIPQA